MAINPNLLFEMNDNRQLVIVRSESSAHAAFLRFTNRTSRPVDVWWRDFNGIKRFYVRLKPGAYFEINSFLTHPWQFTDASTNESYAINNQLIFRAPNHIGGMLYRTNWNISVTVRSLTRTALIYLAGLLPNPEAAATLELPMTLATDLAELVNLFQNTPPVPPLPRLRPAE